MEISGIFIILPIDEIPFSWYFSYNLKCSLNIVPNVKH